MTRRHGRWAAPLLALILLTSCTPADSTQQPQPAPPLSGPGMDGVHYDLADLEGSVVVVSVWASWCGPCRQEIPVLSRAQEELGPEGLVVLGLNFRDHPSAAQEFVEEEQPGFPSVVDNKGTISVGWGVSALPQTFLVDRQGRVVERHFGAVTDTWVKDVVAPEVRP